MTPEAIQSAADLLWEHWRSGRRLEGGLPEAIRPRTREEGYAIQQLVEQRSAAPLFGWKIAATSAAGQAHLRVDGPLAGRVLAERVFADGAVLPIEHNAMRVAETEFAFRMGRTLRPRAEPYNVEEVVDAVETLHPAIEIPDSRFEDFVTAGAPQILADNACAHLLVVGPAAPVGWRDIDLAGQVVTGKVLGRIERQGVGAAVLGDPRIALTWLVNELSGLGLALKAGEVVTTGVCVEPLPIQPGDQVINDMGVLGQVSARFAPG